MSIKHSYHLIVTREDGSFYVLDGHPDKLRTLQPKPDLFGPVADTLLVRRPCPTPATEDSP